MSDTKRKTEQTRTKRNITLHDDSLVGNQMLTVIITLTSHLCQQLQNHAGVTKPMNSQNRACQRMKPD
jgi:hypothetical protein